MLNLLEISKRMNNCSCQLWLEDWDLRANLLLPTCLPSKIDAVKTKTSPDDNNRLQLQIVGLQNPVILKLEIITGGLKFRFHLITAILLKLYHKFSPIYREYLSRL